MLEATLQQTKPAKVITEKQSYAATAALGNKESKPAKATAIATPLPTKQTAKQRKQEQE